MNDNRKDIKSETTYKRGAGVEMARKQLAEEAGRLGSVKQLKCSTLYQMIESMEENQQGLQLMRASL